MPNRFVLKRARELRQRMTLPEKVLWQFLRGGSFAGLRFRRQHPIGDYITDFCCPQKKLVIELDGGCHDITKQEDAARDEFLEKLGFRVLHFTNDHVFDRIDWILQTVAGKLKIDWEKDYHDCVASVKYPQRLHALLNGIQRYRERNH
jgi:very-short-patch-repair endonuclease